MLENAEGSVDGVNVRQFDKGKTYDLPPILANSFVDTGRGEFVGRTPTDPHSGPEADAGEEEEETPSEEPNASEDEDEGAEGSVTLEPTTEGSNWYQFRDPSGDLITETDDGEEEPIKVLGKSNAEDKRDELNQLYDSDADS